MVSIADIRERKAKVAVIGLGWMGLPMAALYADAGFEVAGYDINEKLVEAINEGKIKRREEELDEILSRTLGKNFYATTDQNRLRDADIISVIVPLVIDENRNIEWRSFEKAIETVADNLKEKALVMIHTTMPIGGTRKRVKPILDKAKKKYYLAYLPIRAMTPHVIPDIRERYPRIVGGVDEESTKLAVEFLRTFFKNRIIEMKLEDAEATKIFEIVYRDVNIALANELAVYCEKLGLDFWEIRKAANTVPDYRLHKPGVGVGGHCLPVYPYFLLNLLERDEELGLVRRAREINDHMPVHAVELFQEEEGRKGIRCRTVCVFGFGYRAGIGEVRFSPSIRVAEELKKAGYEVWVCDPYVDDEVLAQWGKPVSIEEGLKADGMIFCTEHPEFKEIGDKIDENKVVIDGRNIFGGRFRRIGT